MKIKINFLLLWELINSYLDTFIDWLDRNCGRILAVQITILFVLMALINWHVFRK